jgi:hypothetical protein
MLSFKVRESAVGLIEFEVVHLAIARFDTRHGRDGSGRCGDRRRKAQYENQEWKASH